VVITANQTVQLTDALDRDLGTLVIEEVRDELLLGEFTPGADYPAVREIFEGFSDRRGLLIVRRRSVRHANRGSRYPRNVVQRDSTGP